MGDVGSSSTSTIFSPPSAAPQGQKRPVPSTSPVSQHSSSRMEGSAGCLAPQELPANSFPSLAGLWVPPTSHRTPGPSDVSSSVSFSI